MKQLIKHLTLGILLLFVVKSTDAAWTNTAAAVASKAPASRQITINGVTQDLTADRTWTVGAASYNNSPSITLNTSTQISTTKNTRVSYSVGITTAVSLLNLNSSGSAFLEISPNNSTWTTINSAGVTRALSVAITIGLNETQTYNIQGEVPAAYWHRIRTTTSGGGSVAFVSGQQVQY